MNCKSCNSYIEKKYNYCSYCGAEIKNISDCFINFFKYFIVVIFIFNGIIGIILNNILLVIISAFLIVFWVEYLVSSKFYNYYIGKENPNYKLLFFLFKLKIISQECLFLIEYQRKENGLSSIFNNGEGLIIECENNCHNKNEVQLNFINQMKSINYKTGGNFMNWNDVKKIYPSQWVLIEAIQARTENDKRIVEKMDVLEGFGEDGDKAFKRYIELHKLHKEREYYIYHTSHETLNIGVKKWMGVRS